MCQASVYLNDEKIMEDVIWVKPVAGGIQIRTFFEEPVVVKGAISGVDLLKHRILLVSAEENQLCARQEGNRP
ncbi:MAG: CooT family nickel-binding protein [Candidatus Brocadia sp.]|jgi:Predicted RNA-binding protein|uniref:RNA-binding protein n=1 Tax=Candidatus Brocadia fulgida TaxID=380242 RepID=A0A0M2UU93_9BACT|nr:MAG: putative RNA-binding protein [Candidatus Brocadia fulgida]UJS21612.1 MAG: CooT family nickel-binding protein [Candidatus Brocadia sp.]